MLILALKLILRNHRHLGSSLRGLSFTNLVSETSCILICAWFSLFGLLLRDLFFDFLVLFAFAFLIWRDHGFHVQFLFLQGLHRFALFLFVIFIGYEFVIINFIRLWIVKNLFVGFHQKLNFSKYA